MKIDEYESVMNGLFSHNTDAAKKAIQFSETVLSALIDDERTEAFSTDVLRVANFLFMLNSEIENGHLDIVRPSTE